MFTASAEPPERGRPVKHLLWPARATSIIWSRWRKCWAIKFPWFGPQMIGLWPTHLNPLPRSADRVCEDPGDSGASFGQPSGLKRHLCQKNQNRAGFRVHFSALALGRPQVPTPRPQRMLPHRLPENGRGGKKGALSGPAESLSPGHRPNKPEGQPQFRLPGRIQVLAGGLNRIPLFVLDKVLIFT